MRIHFIAIGGAAMHNLALAVASKKGYVVTGSDDEIFDPARTHLAQAGLLPERIGWDPERITPDIDAIISLTEKRFVDVALRHGLNDFTLDKWKAFIGTKAHFDHLCGCNIYELLPNVLENSSVNLL